VPPILALTAYIIFEVIVLKLEKKQSPGMSRFLWIPTIWLIYVSSKPLAFWISNTGTDQDYGSPLDRIFMISMICAAVFWLIRKKLDWRRAFRDNVPLIAFFCFMFLSILWSDIPLISIKRWTRELLAMLMAFCLLIETSPIRAALSAIRRTIYILIPLSVVLIKYYPQYGISYGRWFGERMWIGVSLQKNGLACLCFIAIFFLIWSLVRRQKDKVAIVWKYENYIELSLIAISIWLIRGPNGDFFYSATSFYSLMIGLCLLGGFIYFKNRKLNLQYIIVVLIISIFLFGISILFTSTSNIGIVTSAAGRDDSLTGRTEIWAALLPVVMKNPILGKGYGGFWTRTTREYYDISESHNGYLEAMLGFGFSGLLFILNLYLSFCRKAFSVFSSDFFISVLFACLIIMVLVYNTAECSLDSFTYQLSAIMLFISVSTKKPFLDFHK